MKINFIINRLKGILRSWKALWLYTFGDDEKAIIEFESCLRLDPKNGPNLKALGTLLIRKGRYQEGISKLKEALKYFPDNEKSVPEALAYIAYAFFELDRLDEAFSFYRKALSCWREDGDFKKTDLFYTIGRIYLQKKDYIAAKDIFLEGMKLNDKEANIHFGLGLSYYEIGQIEDSLYHLKIAIELDPSLKDNETMKKLQNKIEPNITVH